MNVKNWPVVTGCERLSPGCDNCPTYWEYEEKGWDYHPKSHMEAINAPLENKEPTTYMVASGSDLFHESVRFEFLQHVFDVMREASWHNFEVITKRIERMEALSNRGLLWPINAVAGITVEDARFTWRIDRLRGINARRMVSFGPMVGEMGELNMKDIDIAGVVIEQWGKPRPVKSEWVTDIHKQCEEQGVEIVNNYWVSQETA